MKKRKKFVTQLRSQLSGSTLEEIVTSGQNFLKNYRGDDKIREAARRELAEHRRLFTDLEREKELNEAAASIICGFILEDIRESLELTSRSMRGRQRRYEMYQEKSALIHGH